MDVSRHLMSLILLVFVLATFFSTALTRHRIRHHRDRFKRQQGAHLYLPGSFVLSGGDGEREAGPWTDWGPPSACSRSCGGGVASQMRQCYQPHACRGPDTRHYSCNTQDCPDDADYRAQQCSEFDRQPFEGVQYQWIPYTKAPNPCELNCMPRGERFYYRHKKQVADGTRCSADSLDVCVNGQCQPVGCDMMLGSDAREDKCRQCGGNGTTCQTLDGVLDMQDLQVGYNDILLIPAGATNIDVTERSPSNNYLAVRNVTGHYYLNGNWRIDFPKTLRFAGCNFHYERSPQGFAAPDSITCLGPTYEPLYIVLLYQDVNVGVHYEYSIPKAISSDPETYAWIHGEFGECTTTCGGGYQIRNVSCAGRRSLEIVEKTLCDASTEPASTQVCGDRPCEPQWTQGPWGQCSEVCGEEGVQIREIKCERIVSAGVSTVVNDQYCEQKFGPKPEVKQDCNRGIPCPIWFTGPWKPCDRLCGDGKEKRQVLCYRKVDGKIKILNDTYCEVKESKPETVKTCNLRPCEGVDWVTSEWSGCDKCGLASETRKVHCATQLGKVYPDQLCEGENKPEIVRKCEKSKACDAQWYASQWSECSANCGSGVQTRNVFCATFEGDTLKKIEDSKCDEKIKYDTLMNCTAEEEVCAGEWFTGPWSKCDKPCGSGTRNRKILCMKEEEVIPVSNCDANLIPFSNEACNQKPCGDDEILPVNTTKPVEEKDISTEKSPSEWDPDDDVETIDDDECEEWEDDDGLEKLDLKVDITSIGSSLATGSSSFDDEFMLSDSTYSSDDTKETSFTEEGSGDFTSGSTSSDFSSETSLSTDSKSDLTTIEGSGETTAFETTESGTSDETIASEVTTSASTDESGTPDQTDETEDSQGTTVASSDETKESSDVTTPDTTDSSDFSDTTDKLSDSTDSTPDTTDSSSDSIDSSQASTDSSDTDSSQISTDISQASTDSSQASIDTSQASIDPSPASTDSSQASTDSSQASTDSSQVSTDSSQDNTDFSQASTDSSVDSSDSSDLTTVSSATEDSTDPSKFSDLTSDSSDLTEMSTQSSDISDSSDSTDSSDSSDSTTPSNTDETSSTDSTSDETSPSSDSTSETTPVSTESSEFTSDSSSSTVSDSSDLTTAESTDITTDISVDVTTESAVTETTEEEETEKPLPTRVGESDFGEFPDDFKTKSFTSTPTSSDLSSDVTTTSDVSTDISLSSEETTVSGTEETEITETTLSGATAESTVSGATEESTVAETTEESTVSGATEETTVSGGTEESTVSEATEESTVSGATDETTVSETEESTIAETTVSGLLTETEMLSSTVKTSDETSESELTNTTVTTESESIETTETTESGPTETTVTTESGPTETPETTVSGPAETTETTESGPTDTTLFDIWSTTESSLTTEEGEESVSGTWGTTPYTIEAITKIKKGRKCKKKKSTCKNTPFGCCYDLITPAQGPFDKGCPVPKTCNETKFGCCEDGVSPATGDNFEGCPKSDCLETIFGCCPDNTTAAEGNDFEGCEKEPPPPECLLSEFGCCSDNITVSTGPDGEGCKDCEKSKFGCCPDGVTEATGEFGEGCPESVTEPAQVEDCANSTFGCCPDGESVAQGQHFKGCDIINKDNCTASYFGCCPDGTSSALGPSFEGCRMACEDEQYGCCSDRITAAHGPNQEGCCLVHPYGCCPDNIIPARGPNLEGCGCQYSPYGCCPDNQTAARGHGNEGCGCQHTTHGCCPDRYTPAAGPNNQGCLCHTFQFGCCPDGVSVAKGPRKQGCGCSSTEFGCCSDDQTPAQGPDQEGCDCSSSKHGCCPDGVTDAQGENFAGCQDIPVNKQEICVLSKDRGSCNNYTVKWFFDMEYGGCSRFWYGGCEGNANRFMNMEECKGTCIEPQGKEICQLPKVTGACEGYYPSWYYDKERKQCAQFVWGGCLGNTNRFETREECQNLCVVDTNQDPCEQLREEGPCQGSYRRWHFNANSNTCDLFRYGGCKGNNNNFITEMACKQQCLQPGRKKDLCALPRAQGNCTQNEPRWYFDVSENRCMPFYYSGCEGNQNRFTSREACEADCPTDVERDLCTLPALMGECHNYTERWYYDTNEGRCRLFYYGSCGGNENNFNSQQACLQRCEPQLTTVAPAQVQEPFQREHCFLPSEVGPCRTSQARWFYDSRDGVCKQFLYGGCQGNSNNFETREECHQRCGNVQELCTLPMVVGPCNSDYLQWFYDKESDTCQEFNYGGCQGNDNRFNDQASCEHRCKKRPAVTQGPPPQEHFQTTKAPHFDAREPPSAEGLVCYSPVDVGNCSDSQPAWFYDAASQRCQAFVYTGCGGNANRFISEEQCQRHCGPFRGLDVCSHPKDTGNCASTITKWFYNRDSGRCEQFSYGGCGGSGNRFSFVEECESVCVRLVEPPSATKNETSPPESHVAICLLPVEVGPCEGQYHTMRWHFDEERRNCVSFIYSGCGGNQNNFRTYQQCMDYCRAEFDQRGPPENEIDVEEKPAKSPCEEYRDECTSLLCPYGTEGYVDVEMCNRCRCYDPCRDTQCPENTTCTIDLNPNASQPHQTQFIAACRSPVKEGVCPEVSGDRVCNHECRTDLDCSGELKCCPTSCGTACMVPMAPELLLNTTLPAYTEAPHYSGGDSPVILDDQTDTDISAEEGSYVTMKCTVQGNPHPTITWRRENVLIDGSLPRHRIHSDGTLQIVGLYKNDAGTYHCIADNKIGNPARKDIRLTVTEPTPHPASVIGGDDSKITVTLGAPYSLRCFAYGWPRPAVTWWRGDSMLPMSSLAYEQKRDYTLLIRSVVLTNLGVYTCQAYNGLGKAASWSLTVQALGPVHTKNPDDEPFKQFLVSPVDRPTTVLTPRPWMPYRPTRPPPPPTTPRPVVTPQPFIAPNYTEPSPEIIPVGPAVYTVPVRTNITMSQTTFPVGSEISIPCDVDGHPIPRVQWFKGGQPVQPSENIQISESHRITITKANSSDSGEYLCEAENGYSQSSSSVHIRVEGIYIHPNCTDNPFFANCGLIVQAHYCTHKYYARFCCKSCTQAGQLPSYGPHLATEARKEDRSSNTINK